MITNLLTLECINLNLKGQTKQEIIDEMVEILYQGGKLNDKEEYKKAILAREAQSSTGLEEGIAIPHAKTSAVKIPSVIVIFLAFLAKIIGTFIACAVYKAGAIPDASIVTTLVTPASL